MLLAGAGRRIIGVVHGDILLLRSGILAFAQDGLSRDTLRLDGLRLGRLIRDTLRRDRLRLGRLRLGRLRLAEALLAKLYAEWGEGEVDLCHAAAKSGLGGAPV